MRFSRNFPVELYLNRHRVISGPFAGIRLESYSDFVARPKWLGTYEKELRETWSLVVQRQPKVIFDIGCAEGYYAIGLLKALPNATMKTWESESRECAILNINADRNRVSQRLSANKTCCPDSLQAAIKIQTPDLVICDIEGGEAELFTPRILERLRETLLVIETHGVETCELLCDYIGKSHKWHVINPQPRTLGDWPIRWATTASREFKLSAMQEGRVVPTPWIVATPK